MATKRATTPGFRDERYRRLIERLAARRKDLGLSQQTLAERLGLHKQFVSRVELGERRLDVVEFADMVRALGLVPEDLVRDIP
jgi:transcriptional regulator with XRE-family HTH domain